MGRVKVLVIHANSVLLDMFRRKEQLAPGEVRWVTGVAELRGYADEVPRIVDLGYMVDTMPGTRRGVEIDEEIRRRGYLVEAMSL